MGCEYCGGVGGEKPPYFVLKHRFGGLWVYYESTIQDDYGVDHQWTTVQAEAARYCSAKKARDVGAEMNIATCVVKVVPKEKPE